MQHLLYIIILLFVITLKIGCTKEDKVEQEVSLQTFHLDPREVIKRFDFDRSENWHNEFYFRSEYPCNQGDVKGEAISKIENGKLLLKPRVDNNFEPDVIYGAFAFWQSTDPALKIISNGLKGGIGIEIGYDKCEARKVLNPDIETSSQLQIKTSTMTAITTLQGIYWDFRTDGKIHIYLLNDVLYRPIFNESTNDWQVLGCDRFTGDYGYKVSTSLGMPEGHLEIVISSFISRPNPNSINQECKANEIEIDYIELYRLK